MVDVSGSGSGGTLAGPALAKLRIGSDEGRFLLAAAVSAHVGPHEVEQMAGAEHVAPPAHLAERDPCCEGRAEALDWRLVDVLRCHMTYLTADLLALSHDPC